MQLIVVEIRMKCFKSVLILLACPFKMINCVEVVWPGGRWSGRNQQPGVWAVRGVIRKGQV